jgi:hypothetical protein
MPVSNERRRDAEIDDRPLPLALNIHGRRLQVTRTSWLAAAFGCCRIRSPPTKGLSGRETKHAVWSSKDD